MGAGFVGTLNSIGGTARYVGGASRAIGRAFAPIGGSFRQVGGILQEVAGNLAAIGRDLWPVGGGCWTIGRGFGEVACSPRAIGGGGRPTCREFGAIAWTVQEVGWTVPAIGGSPGQDAAGVESAFAGACIGVPDSTKLVPLFPCKHTCRHGRSPAIGQSTPALRNLRGSSQRAGDKPQRIGAEDIFIGFKKADHLAGNQGMIFVVLGAVRELIERQSEPLAMPANNPDQRHVFRQPVPTCHRRPQLNS